MSPLWFSFSFFVLFLFLYFCFLLRLFSLVSLLPSWLRVCVFCFPFLFRFPSLFRRRSPASLLVHFQRDSMFCVRSGASECSLCLAFCVGFLCALFRVCLRSLLFPTVDFCCCCYFPIYFFLFLLMYVFFVLPSYLYSNNFIFYNFVFCFFSFSSTLSLSCIIFYSCDDSFYSDGCFSFSVDLTCNKSSLVT